MQTIISIIKHKIYLLCSIFPCVIMIIWNQKKPLNELNKETEIY